MPVREIRLYGDPVLNSKCNPINDFGDKAKALIEDLIDTTKEPGRAGVAAPQIGVSLRAFSYNANGNLGYLINPEELVLEGEPELVEEGCLSVPGLWHKTLRYPKASLSGYQLDGTRVTVKGEGLLAQALQHEYDHLDGKLYLDRLSIEERKEAMKILRQTDWFLR
jgi:peptide deformylase